jgi:hypothetical protein
MAIACPFLRDTVLKTGKYFPAKGRRQSKNDKRVAKQRFSAPNYHDSQFVHF